MIRSDQNRYTFVPKLDKKGRHMKSTFGMPMYLIKVRVASRRHKGRSN